MQISTGIPSLDRIMGGGIMQEQLTFLYGEAGAGKTGLVLQLAFVNARRGLKTIFVQTGSRFPSERFKQIAGGLWKQAVEQVPILELHDFDQQQKLAETLRRYASPTVKLVVWDTFTSLYRAALSSQHRNVELNKSMNRQLALLLQVAREREISIVLSAEMHGVVHTAPSDESVEWGEEGPVAEGVLDYWTQTRMRLEKASLLNQRRLTVERHPAVATSESIMLQITSTGIEAA